MDPRAEPVTMPPSLVLRAPRDPREPSWLPHRVIALPVAVTTAAWAMTVDAELPLWINGPRAGHTEQLRVLPTYQVERLPPLPIVMAGVTRCESELVATGASAAGQPVVVGLSADGAILWQHVVPGPLPSMWPVPHCAPEPVIAWQTSPEKLELARVDAGGIGRRRTAAVGGPPLAVAAVPGAVWGAWADRSGIHGREITTRHIRDIYVASGRPGTFAIGACSGGACLAWTVDGTGFLSRVAPGMTATEPAVALDLAHAAGGTLTVISGPEPIVWAQRAETIEGEPPRWRSVLVQPGAGPIEVDGLVHAVSWWGDAVAVVGARELVVLERRGTSEVGAP